MTTHRGAQWAVLAAFLIIVAAAAHFSGAPVAPLMPGAKPEEAVVPVPSAPAAPTPTAAPAPTDPAANPAASAPQAAPAAPAEAPAAKPEEWK